MIPQLDQSTCIIYINGPTPVTESLSAQPGKQLLAYALLYCRQPLQASN